MYFYPEQNPRYDTITHYGFIRHAFVLSFYYLLLADQQKKDVSKYYHRVIQETASLSGDADTNCAIVGGLIGAYVGVH